MNGAGFLISSLSFHQPGLLGLFVLVAIPLAWCSGGQAERASILALVATVLADLAAWLLGGALIFHLVADCLALSWILPIALKSDRYYPTVMAAGALVAVTVQLLGFAELEPNRLAIDLVTGAAHLVAVVAFAVGWKFNRQGAVWPGRYTSRHDEFRHG